MPKTASRSQRQPTVASSRVPSRVERTPLERVMRLIASINLDEVVTAVTFAAEFGVTPLTIKRDIAMLRDQLRMPIEWDRVRKTYYFTRPCECVPLLQLNEREVLMLAVVGRVIESWRSVPFGRELDAIVKKIAQVLGGAVSIAADSIDRVLSLPAAEARTEMEHFLPVLEAVRARRQLRLEYASAQAATPEKRVVHPLHLAHSEGRWGLLAFDPVKRKIRTFLLMRMRKLTLQAATFEPPPDFDAAKHLRGSMGAFAGDEEHDIRIALDAHATFYARETPWHSSQILTALPDGRTELRLGLNHLADAKIVALRWGEHAEVLAPAELRKQMRDSLEAATAQNRR